MVARVRQIAIYHDLLGGDRRRGQKEADHRTGHDRGRAHNPPLRWARAEPVRRLSHR
jgi:hypothetical protein